MHIIYQKENVFMNLIIIYSEHMLIKTKIELLSEPLVHLAKEKKAACQRCTCISMFIAALFAKPRYPPSDYGQNVWYICKM